jgi:hypothetical protein
MQSIEKRAVISACGAFRYELQRFWVAPGQNYRPAVFVMLNPSVADAEIDDPTIRRCMGFARREGLNGVHVVNLFAYRATKPEELKKVPDPVGPANDEHLRAVFRAAAYNALPVVAAWGVHGALQARNDRVRQMAQNLGVTLSCLGTSKAGHPKHPLYIAGDQPLVEYAA